MHHKDEQKKAQKCSYLVSTDMIKKYMFFLIDGDGGKRK
jgi:hypothetical protein